MLPGVAARDREGEVATVFLVHDTRSDELFQDAVDSLRSDAAAVTRLEQLEHARGTLRTIAESSGGRYFRARDTQELEQIYRLLDELEPVDEESRYFRPVHALYPWPLAVALLLALPPIWFYRGGNRP